MFVNPVSGVMHSLQTLKYCKLTKENRHPIKLCAKKKDTVVAMKFSNIVCVNCYRNNFSKNCIISQKLFTYGKNRSCTFYSMKNSALGNPEILNFFSEICEM